MFNLDEEKIECALGNTDLCFGRVRNPIMLCVLPNSNN